MSTSALNEVLAEARSCLAALADQAQASAVSAAYERLLIDFDGLFRDRVPGISELDERDEHVLFARAESAIEALIGHGMDALTAELLLAELAEIRGGGEAPPPF